MTKKKFSFSDFLLVPMRNAAHARREKVSVTRKERKILDELYKETASLKDEGIENFFGYYVSYDKVLDALCKAWPGENVGYNEDPLELVVRLIYERDEANAEIERLKRIQERQQQIIQRHRAVLNNSVIEIRRMGKCLNEATTKNRDFETINKQLKRRIVELEKAGVTEK